MRPYAKINSVRIVINIQLLDDGDTLDPNFTWIDIENVVCGDGSSVSPGCTYDGTNFAAMPLDANGRSVQFQTDGSADTYSVIDLISGNFSIDFPTGTSQGEAFDTINSTNVPNKGQTIQLQMTKFNNDAVTYAAGKISQQQQDQLLRLYILAKFGGLANRAAYIEPMLIWANSLVAYAAQVAGQMQAAANAQAVMKITWDIASNTGAAPNVNALGAISIPN